MAGIHTSAVHTCLESDCGHEIKSALADYISCSPAPSEQSDHPSASVDEVSNAPIPPWQRVRKPTASGRRDAVTLVAPIVRPAVAQPPLPVKPIQVEKSQRLFALATDYTVSRWQVKLEHGWKNFFDGHQEVPTAAKNLFLSSTGPATMSLSWGKQ